ncbi:hypothetical protein [Shewanella algae]|uniref:Uncharacterized protein n=1 Tax=Shewanella algae TaxID=38313 RepID=A0A379YKH4_9GAMM|nr:hypothetical protein [Shewanella algae]MBO2606931.1 hypothetical protein [Shewanella algae]QTE85430.1 hypothetical protein JKK44_15245 [Shewanella algae]SUI46360.1 Uncharacterised protein [Shewanella algae]
MNNKINHTPAASNVAFKELYTILHDQGLAYVQGGAPEREYGTSHYDHAQKETTKAFERASLRAHRNMIAIDRLSRMKPDAAESARLVFTNLPKSGQELIEKLCTIDFSSSRRFLASLGRAGATSDYGIWDFPDLRTSERPDNMGSGFANYCASLYPKNKSETALTESIMNSRVQASLDATHDTLKRLGAPSGLEQTEKFQQVKEREGKNIRLIKVMDDFREASKNKTFSHWLNKSDTALRDGFDAAASELWAQFSRNDQSQIFGKLPRLVLVVRALQTVAVSSTNEFSRASLLDRAPALMRSLSSPNLARNLIKMVTAVDNEAITVDAQTTLDKLEMALATTPAGGAFAEALLLALPVLMVGEVQSLQESGDQSPDTIEQEILEGIRADIGQLITLDLE